MKKRKVIIAVIAAALSLIAIGIGVYFSLMKLPYKEISIAADVDYESTEEAKETDELEYFKEQYKYYFYDFDGKKIVYIRFSIKNNTNIKLRNMHITFNNLQYYAKALDDFDSWWEGAELTCNPKSDGEFSMPFAVEEKLNEEDLAKSFKYSFTFDFLKHRYRINSSGLIEELNVPAETILVPWGTVLSDTY